jgi:hypothetical protein
MIVSPIQIRNGGRAHGADRKYEWPIQLDGARIEGT